jgi:phosphoglycolate phosphatase-like HAD superfamily hydrolase
MLIIFDVDGTLVGGESQDWASFGQAIAAVLGSAPAAGFFDSLTEFTAQAIVEAAIQASDRETGLGLEERIRDEYLNRLGQVHAANPLAFPARAGVVALLRHLGGIAGITVAIATGDWHATIAFKLAAAGIDVGAYPMATSSNARRRSEIIRLAAQRANRPLADAVYVGDGLWDLRACRELGVPFIGTGTRTDRLRMAGAEHIVEEFEIPLFLATLQSATQPGKSVGP